MVITIVATGGGIFLVVVSAQSGGWIYTAISRNWEASGAYYMVDTKYMYNIFMCLCVCVCYNSIHIYLGSDTGPAEW